MTSKHTVITATRIDAPAKPDVRRDYAGFDAWQKNNRRYYTLRGYWAPEKALAYAAAKGFQAERIEHKDEGLFGKSWSRGVDKVFAVIEGRPVAVNG